jgi:glucokinase
MDSSAGSYLGIEIGGTKLQIVAGDESGRIIHRWRATADRARGGPGICDQILQGLTEIRKRVVPIAIGVGFGGPIDWKTGRIARSHQIDGWEGFELGQWLSEQTGLPVACENDSNLAALAEATRGAGAGYSPVFYFNLGSGVGGGFIVDGRIYHGLPPGEAEFGHVRLDRSGATVESRCSGWAVDKRVRLIATHQPQSVLGQAVAATTGGEARALATALNAEDRAALVIIEELADDIAFGLSHVVHLLHPALIVMGGGLSLIGEPLRRAVADAMPKYVMDIFAPGPPLKSAVLGEDAVPVGALQMACNAKQIHRGDTEGTEKVEYER